MAEINPTVVANSGDFSTRTYKFEQLGNGDTTAPIAATEYADRSIQVLGTFDTTTIIAEGSNDGGATWAPLTDYQDNAISFTAAGLEGVAQVTGLLRMRVTAGGAGTDVDVYVVARRQTPNRQ